MKQSDKIYGRFAEVYDQLGGDLHSVRMAQQTFEMIRAWNLDIQEMLDLGCGTGTAVKIFSEAGFNAEGLDGSARMLKVARKKLAGHKARLYCQKLPRFKIPEKRGSRKLKQYDLITSFYDSLNYLLTARELKQAFGSAYKHLKANGYFVFDMNTPHALKHTWDGDVHTELNDDWAIIWNSKYDPKTVTARLDATFFIRVGQSWARFDEVHKEAGYSTTLIKKLLREVGFQVRGIYHCLTMEKPTRETNRICVVARRVK